MQVGNAGLSSYVIDGLKQGTYYFAVKAYTNANAESGMSNVMSRVIK